MNPFNLFKKTGQQGEDLAARHLQQNGYKIIARNYRNRYGEIDIIARERGVVCFVEVKARSSEACGSPSEAVSRAKQAKIERLALAFLQERNLEDVLIRFDVVAVTLSPGKPAQVEILPDAFQATEEA